MIVYIIVFEMLWKVAVLRDLRFKNTHNVKNESTVTVTIINNLFA